MTTFTQLSPELLVESSIDAMIGIDRNGIVRTWNNAASFLYEQPADDAIGKPLTSVLPSVKADNEFLASLGYAQTGKKAYLPAKAGLLHRGHAELHLIPLSGEKGIEGVLILSHDVSHRIQKELQLEALNDELAQRLRQIRGIRRDLGHLTEVAAHNLRDPIRTIYTSIENLISTEGSSVSDKGRASFRRIQSSLNRMNLLLGDIILLNQIHIAEKANKLVDVEAVLAQVRALLARKLEENNVQFTVGELCKMLARENLLLLMLQHIIGNAVTANESAKPFVHVTCKPLTHLGQAGSLYHEVPAGDYYQLVIQHNGKSFKSSEELQVPLNNETSHNLNPTQTSIAWVIAATVVEAHGGYIVLGNSKDGIHEINCFFPVAPVE